jgi:hypothetical protein
MKSRIRGQHRAIVDSPRRTGLLAGLSLAVALGMGGAIGLGFPPAALAATADSSLTITVQVDNYSQASPAVLGAAEHEAGRILGEAGLRVVWLECSTGVSTKGLQGPCHKAPEATDVRLRILGAPIRNVFQDSVFGFTVHPVLASVYYDYAVRRAKSDDAEFELPIILGCVIAHELGHLLLGSNGHSDKGIMQPRWEANQVRQLMMGTLLFTADQSTRIRAAARVRAEHRNLASTSSMPPD